MIVRLVSRNDAPLVVGLVIGAIVVFQTPLHFLLDVARDIEVRYHVDLLPALTILSVVFIFHQYRKRQQATGDARAAAAATAVARARSEELERLITFSQALANVLDLPTLQHVLWRYLPVLAREHDCWVLYRQDHRWLTVMQAVAPSANRPIEIVEAMADQAADETRFKPSLEGVSVAGGVCFPMRAAGAPVGVLGIHDGAGLTVDDRRAIGAGAALIAIALKNVHLFGETRDHSVRDGLTGCFNREHAMATLDNELRRAKRSTEPLSILMFDIDHFKTINDELGHLQGDAILRALGAQLTRVLRSTDIRCRYGGDEFLIVLPGTGIAGAEQVAQNLRRELQTLTVAGADRVYAVTVSLGVTNAALDELDVAALIARADDALYQAKRAGRNRVCVTPPGSQTSSAAPAERVAPASAEPQPADDGTETVLVVDDEPLICEQIRRLLEARGYTILPAPNGAEAIAIAAAHRGPIHLLVTDIIMPGLRGPDLARHIRSRRPEVKVLYVSGFQPPGAGDPALSQKETAFLQKPFTRTALLTRVRALLDATTGAVDEPRVLGFRADHPK